jgi:2-polyprenyl-3-methyl-5-hydroxy-6-metoxy-1,4-benzoquinol methylase
MPASYKQKFYSNYISTHNGYLYQKPSLQAIEDGFVVWDWFYRKILPTDLTLPILDIGCGNGAFVHYLTKKGYSNVQGIDVSPEQIEEGTGLGIANLIRGDFRDHLTTTSERYAMIIARDVIEHFERQEVFDILQLVNQSLIKGGIFIMQVPNGQGLFYESIFYGDFTHEMAYTESSVRQLFLNCGFSSSQCYPTGPVGHTWKGRVRSMLWSLKVAHHRFWKMVETGNASGIFTSNLIAVGEKR